MSNDSIVEGASYAHRQRHAKRARPHEGRAAGARCTSQGHFGPREAFRTQLASSEEFAQRFDEAVMRQNHRAILALVDEVGLPKEAEVRILELDPDRKIRLEICIFAHCVSVTFEY
jgi:hypothetical protein